MCHNAINILQLHEWFHSKIKGQPQYKKLKKKVIWLGLMYWVVAHAGDLPVVGWCIACFHQLGENPLYYQHVAPMYVGGKRVYSLACHITR